MAKVIRNRWVFRPHGRWHRYLPRRNDAIKEFDYEAAGGSLNHFREDIGEELNSSSIPSKLWLAWVYRDLATEPKWTRERVEKIFGTDWKVGQAEVLLNSEAVNQELWHIKHLIELKPISFPKGEPTEKDLYGITVNHNGVCDVAPNAAIVSEETLKLMDKSKQWSSNQLSQQLDAKYYGFKDVFERNVYTPSNISIVK